MNGWVKLYRQVANNKIFNHDLTAWHVFEILLIFCKDGVWEGGRFQLSECCNLKDGTTYKAIKRLEKAKMVTLSSNNKFTKVEINNWHKFQDTVTLSGNNKVTTKSQQSNTINKNIRIKELKNNNTTNVVLLGEANPHNQRNPELQNELDKIPNDILQCLYSSVDSTVGSTPAVVPTVRGGVGGELISQEEREKVVEFMVGRGASRELAENELAKFVNYWTEKNHSGTKERWQLERTFEVKRRLATWFSNVNKFSGVKNVNIEQYQI